VVLAALVRGIYRDFQALIHEIAKFGVVGAFNYAVDTGLFNALVVGPLHHRPVTSKVISYALATTSSYFLNRHWTWRHKARTGLMREYWLFAGLSVIALGITLAPLGVSEYLLHEHSLLARNISANLIGVGLATIFRFWSFKRFVFLEAEPAATEDAMHAALS
jgi:putative flippase GtrA